MTEDTFKISQNQDGSFTMIWNPQDPNWKWLNGLTSKEIQVIMEQLLKESDDGN